jgi:uncharacterized protein YutE (UPF0331/DUF86 family)
MDESRILVKLDEIDGYLRELDEAVPGSLEEYEKDTVKRRASERLLHLAIEGTIDVCAVLVRELNLGVPGEEEDLFEKLSGQVLSEDMVDTLRDMKRFRNVLVHRYGTIDDDKVYHLLTHRLHDFWEFKKEVVHFLRNGRG